MLTEDPLLAAQPAPQLSLKRATSGDSAAAERLSEEQSMAIARIQLAWARGHGFLLGNGPGTGKGRCIAALLGLHRGGAPMLWLTERLNQSLYDLICVDFPMTDVRCDELEPGFAGLYVCTYDFAKSHAKELTERLTRESVIVYDDFHHIFKASRLLSLHTCSAVKVLYATYMASRMLRQLIPQMRALNEPIHHLRQMIDDVPDSVYAMRLKGLGKYQSRSLSWLGCNVHFHAADIGSGEDEHDALTRVLRHAMSECPRFMSEKVLRMCTETAFASTLMHKEALFKVISQAASPGSLVVCTLSPCPLPKDGLARIIEEAKASAHLRALAGGLSLQDKAIAREPNMHFSIDAGVVADFLPAARGHMHLLVLSGNATVEEALRAMASSRSAVDMPPADFTVIFTQGSLAESLLASRLAEELKKAGAAPTGEVLHNIAEVDIATFARTFLEHVKAQTPECFENAKADMEFAQKGGGALCLDAFARRSALLPMRVQRVITEALHKVGSVSISPSPLRNPSLVSGVNFGVVLSAAPIPCVPELSLVRMEGGSVLMGAGLAEFWTRLRDLLPHAPRIVSSGLVGGLQVPPYITPAQFSAGLLSADHPMSQRIWRRYVGCWWVPKVAFLAPRGVALSLAAYARGHSGSLPKAFSLGDAALLALVPNFERITVAVEAGELAAPALRAWHCMQHDGDTRVSLASVAMNAAFALNTRMRPLEGSDPAPTPDSIWMVLSAASEDESVQHDLGDFRISIKAVQKLHAFRSRCEHAHSEGGDEALAKLAPRLFQRKDAQNPNSQACEMTLELVRKADAVRCKERDTLIRAWHVDDCIGKFGGAESRATTSQ